MDNAPTDTDAACIAMVGDIVSAYVANNRVSLTELPALIASIQDVMRGLVDGYASQSPAESKSEKPTSAQIRKSVTRDALVSFIDSKRYKTLKRHLRVHGLTPEGYRGEFGLPSDYPMVAAGYSEVRSGWAKSLGLGVPAGRRSTEAREVTAAPKG